MSVPTIIAEVTFPVFSKFQAYTVALSLLARDFFSRGKTGVVFAQVGKLAVVAKRAASLRIELCARVQSVGPLHSHGLVFRGHRG